MSNPASYSQAKQFYLHLYQTVLLSGDSDSAAQSAKALVAGLPPLQPSSASQSGINRVSSVGSTASSIPAPLPSVEQLAGTAIREVFSLDEEAWILAVLRQGLETSGDEDPSTKKEEAWDVTVVAALARLLAEQETSILQQGGDEDKSKRGLLLL